jgi:hypothetical protein
MFAFRLGVVLLLLLGVVATERYHPGGLSGPASKVSAFANDLWAVVSDESRDTPPQSPEAGPPRYNWAAPPAPLLVLAEEAPTQAGPPVVIRAE